jgi:penicillin-binding protein 1C
MGGLVLGLALFYAALALTPYPELTRYRERGAGVVVEARDGLVLRVFPARDGIKREWTPLDSLSPDTLRAFLRAEDRRFSLHMGVDPLAIAAALRRNARAGGVVSGASTITMQLARMVHPRAGGGRGLGGKIAEAFAALRIEAKLSKKTILALWLNGIPFGSNIEGLGAMSRARFGVPASALDTRQALLLAVAPRRPGRYDPALNPREAARQAAALARECGFPLGEEALYEAALEAALPSPEKAPFRAPQFTARVLAQAEAAAQAAGSPPPWEKPLRSSLDADAQALAEELLAAELAGLEAHRVSNGAILAFENASGKVRVYAGSASWFDEEAGGKIDGILSRRQPGSCLKPFLYAMALDNGFGPSDPLPDIPSVFGGQEAYIPSNFNNRFNGPVRLRVALASSLNIPAVYLAERLGVSNVETYLSRLGFDGLAAETGSHGVGIALGNGEVSLEELARAFAVFPRGGVPVSLHFLEDDDDSATPGGESGNALMSPETAWLIADILSDKASRYTGFGAARTFSEPFPAMFKTGTANQFQHIWALGASNRFTVGVWMGNFSGQTVIGRTGSSIPARIVNRLLAVLERAAPAAAQDAPPVIGGPPPPGLREVSICSLSGMARTPLCPGGLDEWPRAASAPGPCTWHRSGGIEYPPEYRAWLGERSRRGTSGRGAGSIRIPRPGAVFYLDQGPAQTTYALRVETAGFGEGAVLSVDGIPQGPLNAAGVYALPLTPGEHRIEVADAAGAFAETAFVVK